MRHLLFILALLLPFVALSQTEEAVIIAKTINGELTIVYPADDLASAIEQGINDGIDVLASNFTITSEINNKTYLRGIGEYSDGSAVRFVVRLYEGETSDGEIVWCVRGPEYELVSCEGDCSAGCEPTIRSTTGNPGCPCTEGNTGTCSEKWTQSTTFWDDVYQGLKDFGGTLVAVIALIK